MHIIVVDYITHAAYKITIILSTKKVEGTNRMYKRKGKLYFQNHNKENKISKVQLTVNKTEALKVVVREKCKELYKFAVAAKDFLWQRIII